MKKGRLTDQTEESQVDNDQKRCPESLILEDNVQERQVVKGRMCEVSLTGHMHLFDRGDPHRWRPRGLRTGRLPRSSEGRRLDPPGDDLVHRRELVYQHEELLPERMKSKAVREGSGGMCVDRGQGPPSGNVRAQRTSTVFSIQLHPY